MSKKQRVKGKGADIFFSSEQEEEKEKQKQSDLEDEKADKQYIGLVTEEQFEFMRELTFKFRSPKINKSSVLRAMIELLKDIEFDYKNIKTERDFINALKIGMGY